MTLNSIFEKATNSHNLTERIKLNAQGGGDVFSKWTDDILSSLKYSNVLDLCCGTGNQLIKYASKENVENIIGVDIAQNSLDIASARLNELSSNANITLKNAAMDDFLKNLDIEFDLISCFYGLYYSSNPKELLRNIIDSVVSGGTVLIVGPYGANNSSIFKLLEKYYELPELVKKSATTFMGYDVLPEISIKTKVTMHTLVNQIYFYSQQDVIDYWKATTFYNPIYEDVIKKELTLYFTKNESFIIEKHVIAYIATKI